MSARPSFTNTVDPTLVGLRATWRMHLKCSFPVPTHGVVSVGLAYGQGDWIIYLFDCAGPLLQQYSLRHVRSLAGACEFSVVT